jgi:hypothetical protein
MKQRTLITIILFGLFGQVQCQIDTSTIYENLEIKKFYSVGLSSQTGGGVDNYEVNGRKVSKQTYDKYHSTWNNMETCCPCILKAYNENDQLLRESVSCTDCRVGWFKEYYLNGNLKQTGSYKENPTGNWNAIYLRGYCSIPDGQWIYFNEKGDTLYSEFWDNGEFIQQFPEQSTAEIWDVELTLKGQKIDKQILAIDQISNLRINPKYKSNHTNSILALTFEVSATGHKINEKKFSIESFNKINVKAMLSEVGIYNVKKTTFVLSVLSDNQVVKQFYLNVKR